MDIIITGLGSLSSGCQDASSLYKASIESAVNSHLMELQTHNAIIHMPVCSVQDDLIDLNALKEFRKLDRTSQLAIHASNQAWLSSGIKEKSVASEKIGVFIGTSRGPVGKWEQTFERQISGKRQLPSFSAAGTIAAISGSVSQCLNASGPSLTISSTCSSGAAAIATGASMIHSGTCDVAVVGGVESVINESILNVMNSAGLLSNHSDHQKSCKPFDRDRNGLVVGEGAAFLILESLSHATSRGAKPLAKLSGWCNGLSQSGKVGVDLTGTSIASTIKNSLKMSNLCASDIDYINAHGTGTILNDLCESRALNLVDGLSKVPISSTKPITGHCLGASPVL
ncbi:MAG: beta-ketoacyl-[acyl-carrier-protein] synthase family protein, partial [Verrucomicrobiota bacterium]|nr:beta-ketoacyl-[acyl-carrier-protein] synthase family protein [Verrucomicrobiota bacterium]